MTLRKFRQRGWVRFGGDPVVRRWAEAARRAGLQAVHHPQNAPWLQCDGTWFVGVDALPNDPFGRLPDGPELTGEAVSFIHTHFGAMPPLHRAQVSVIYPGYPRARAGEDEAAARYRRRRDAAHVDGIKLVAGDQGRRRFLEEPHAWILGVSLNACDEAAAPVVVWEGSHEIMRAAFRTALANVPPEQWSQQDITETYTTARKHVFETCKRVTIPAKPGEAYLVHRLALHGVAPWAEGVADRNGEGRMIAYFRPEVAQWQDWLNSP